MYAILVLDLSILIHFEKLLPEGDGKDTGSIQKSGPKPESIKRRLLRERKRAAAAASCDSNSNKRPKPNLDSPPPDDAIVKAVASQANAEVQKAEVCSNYSDISCQYVLDSSV
jgi:hypothetical protein